MTPKTPGIFSAKWCGCAAGLVMVLASSLPAGAQGSDEQLRKELLPVRFEANPSVAEAECAKLALRYSNSPATIGKIYLSLALNNAYRHAGFSNVIETTQKALQFPLDAMDACEAYESLAGGLHQKMSVGFSEREETALRRQILDAYLNGLKVVLSNAKTLQKQEEPGVNMFHYLGSTNDAMYQEMYQKQQAEWKARNEARAANDLVKKYEMFRGEVIALYRGIPFVEEITEEGDKIMPGAPILNELVEEAEKVNAPLGMETPEQRKHARAEKPMAFNAREYEVEGVIQEHITQPEQADWTTTAKFTVYARDCAWLIETVETNPAGQVKQRRVGSENGTEIFQIISTPKTTPDNATFPGTRRAPRQVGDGQVSSNSIPFGAYNDSIIPHLWVMFASQCYFKAQNPTNRLMPAYYVEPALVERVDLSLEAEWEVMSGQTRLPLKVVYFNPGGFYDLTTNQELIFQKHGPPYKMGFTNAIYSVTGITNFDGVAFPAGYTFALYEPGGGGSRYNLRARKTAEVVVTAFRPGCSRKDLLPAMDDVTMVSDFRLTHANPSGAMFHYTLQKGEHWPPVAEAQALSMIRKRP